MLRVPWALALPRTEARMQLSNTQQNPIFRPSSTQFCVTFLSRSPAQPLDMSIV